MKILAQGVPGNTFSGFQRAAEADGHEWIWWEERHTSTFDVFDEVKPDAVFLMKMTRAIDKCLHEYNTPVVKGGSDQFRFLVGRPTPTDSLIRNSKKLSFEYLVDSHMFSPGEAHPAYKCYIGIACAPNPLGLELCLDVGKHNIKIIHEEPWPVIQYLGIGSLENKRDLYRSSTFVLVDNVMEEARVIACGSTPIDINPWLNGENTGVSLNFGGWCEDGSYDNNKVDISIPCNRVELITPDQRTSYVDGHKYDDALRVILEEIK